MLLFKRAIVWILSVLIALSLVSPTFAQSETSFAYFEIDLWPEYDRSDVLVIYRIEIDSSVSLPAELTFRIPASAGMPHAVAAGQTAETLFNVTAEREVIGEWANVRFTVTLPHVRLEYYDPGLRKDGSQRDFSYRWSGEYAVEQLVVQVQQPINSTEMKIVPGLGSGQVATDGLVYYNAEFGALGAGQEFDLEFSYLKGDETLSFASLDLQPSAPITNETPGRVSMLSWLPWGLGVLGAVLILGSIYWYWRSGRQIASIRPGRGKRGNRTKERESSTQPLSRETPAEGGAGIYCHQCGKRAGTGDKFCRTCGAKLRLE